MASKTDLRDDIIQVAGQLFMKQSYAATSIKQIAKAAGCTTAALYYYFEDGKEAILHEVIVQVMPDLASFLKPLEGVASLQELIMGLGISLMQSGQAMLQRTRWLMVEFPNMGQAERTRLHQMLLHFHQQLADMIEPFVASRHEAEVIAWILYTALFGFGQLFVTLELEETIEPPYQAYVDTLAEMIGQRSVSP